MVSQPVFIIRLTAAKFLLFELRLHNLDEKFSCCELEKMTSGIGLFGILGNLVLSLFILMRDITLNFICDMRLLLSHRDVVIIQIKGTCINNDKIIKFDSKVSVYVNLSNVLKQ